MEKANTTSQDAKEVQVSVPFDTAETIAVRSAIQLANLTSNDASLTPKREHINGPLIWFDSARLESVSPVDGIFSRIINSIYTGVILYTENIETLLPAIPERMQIVLKLKNEDDTKSVYRNDILSEIINNRKNQVIISSASVIDLKKFQGDGYITCFECYVDNNKKLLSTIKDGLKFDYVWILFRDPTNIPLELVIASLQSTNTILMKEINNPENVDDAIVSYGVMEYGAEGVIFSPIHHDILTNFIDRLSAKTNLPIKLQVGTVVSAKPVGMGYRACIDTATIFDEDEGMLVGSTSQGGILCCPEVFFLPYMELRPFRINAGAVHSYVFNINNRTDYMTELKAGSSIMIVNSKGQVRSSPVGRMKIEKRPLRLIEVEFEGGKNINILMQDDWHVRIFSNEAKPLNISELKKGDKVLGYVTETGRHVGIKIDENIIEK